MRALSNLLFCFVVAGLLGGCCGGGSSKVQSSTTTTTTGQELTDLKNAYDSGAITADQYNKMKEKIIEKSGGK